MTGRYKLNYKIPQIVKVPVIVCAYRIEQVRTTLGNAQYPDRQWQVLRKVVPAKQKQPQTGVYPVNGNRKEEPTPCRCVCV